MTPHQFLLLQKQNGLEDRADRFHPLTLRAIRRNILPSPARIPPRRRGLTLIHAESRCLPEPMPTMQIFIREQQSTWQDFQFARYSTATAKRNKNAILRTYTSSAFIRAASGAQKLSAPSPENVLTGNEPILCNCAPQRLAVLINERGTGRGLTPLFRRQAVRCANVAELREVLNACACKLRHTSFPFARTAYFPRPVMRHES
jgi:hypothetical protein